MFERSGNLHVDGHAPVGLVDAHADRRRPARARRR
jgi:hypothetical protein